MINETKPPSRTKGGGPPKEIKRNVLVGVKYTSVEKFMIKANTKNSGLTISGFLRNLGLGSKID